MTMKTATPELHERMRKASANIAAGVRLAKPELELHGRRTSAIAHIENQILLGRALLNKEDVQRLAELLFSTNDADLDTPDDYTADAVETNAEALAKQPTPDYDDEDLEGDEL